MTATETTAYGYGFQNNRPDAEWVEARVAFMKLEAEHKAATIELAKKRQALPWRKLVV
jgi:predicted dithiol-disulfide oxidoreductase (DUF899 family)